MGLPKGKVLPQTHTLFTSSQRGAKFGHSSLAQSRQPKIPSLSALQTLDVCVQNPVVPEGSSQAHKSVGKPVFEPSSVPFVLHLLENSGGQKPAAAGFTRDWH